MNIKNSVIKNILIFSIISSSLSAIEFNFEHEINMKQIKTTGNMNSVSNIDTVIYNKIKNLKNLTFNINDNYHTYYDTSLKYYSNKDKKYYNIVPDQIISRPFIIMLDLKNNYTGPIKVIINDGDKEIFEKYIFAVNTNKIYFILKISNFHKQLNLKTVLLKNGFKSAYKLDNWKKFLINPLLYNSANTDLGCYIDNIKNFLVNFKNYKSEYKTCKPINNCSKSSVSFKSDSNSQFCFENMNFSINVNLENYSSFSFDSNFLKKLNNNYCLNDNFNFNVSFNMKENFKNMISYFDMFNFNFDASIYKNYVNKVINWIKRFSYVEIPKEGKPYFDCVFVNTNNKIINQTNNFAVRPLGFLVKNKIFIAKAGETKVINIKAIDFKGNIVKNYNENTIIKYKNIDNYENRTNYHKIKPKIINNKFVNGILNLEINHSEVDKLLFLVKSSFKGTAGTKNDWQPLPAYFILKVIPYKFDIVMNKYKDYNSKSKINYITVEKLNEIKKYYGVANISIIAKNKNNQITKNFSSGLYSSDLLTKLEFETTNKKYNNNIYINFKKRNNISLKLNKHLFKEGKINFNLKLSLIKKGTNILVNPVYIKLKDIKIIDFYKNNYKTSIKNKDLLKYGVVRIFPDEITTYNNTVDATVEYKYYENNKWNDLIPTKKDLLGLTNIYVIPNYIKFNKVELNKSKEIFNVSLIRDIKPIAITIHLLPNETFYYSKYGLKYKNIFESLNCVYHYCIKLVFLNKNNKNKNILSKKINQNNSSKESDRYGVISDKKQTKEQLNIEIPDFNKSFNN